MMGTNIALRSDFIEGYDTYLNDPMGEIPWKRFSRGGVNRREIFKLLKNYIKHYHFRNVVPNGIVKELYDKYKEREVNGIWNGTWKHAGIQSPFKELVIYEDEMAHRGEGKVIMHVEEAIEECPNAYASVLLCNNQHFFTSYRTLYIGTQVFELTYVSLTDSWRSNCGHVVILYNGHDQFIHKTTSSMLLNEGIRTPIFAFDYIEVPVIRDNYPHALPERFYMDFNEAAGIPEEVVVRDFNSDRYGECIPFSEIMSFEDIALSVEKTLKSEN